MTLNNTEENLARALLLPWVHIGSDGSSITLEPSTAPELIPVSSGASPACSGSTYAKESS